MPTLKDAADEFLKLQNIAVAGISSTKKDAANYIYEKLKKSGYQVFGINPKVSEIEGNPCYPNLSDVPARIDGVVICTNPKVTLSIVEQCAELGIKHAWIHKSINGGSYSKEAEQFCEAHEIQLIPAGCPMMFCKPVDFPHKCMKWILQSFGKLPRSYS